MTEKELLFGNLKKRVDETLARHGDVELKLAAICALLADKVDYYDWVGFYLVDGTKDELVLGPYVGAPTEHVRIPFGRGICGLAASAGETMIIQDVSKETNYLTCSANVRSEIVVPIRDRNGRILGEIDIDSHDIAPFTREDRELLEHIAARLSDVIPLR